MAEEINEKAATHVTDEKATPSDWNLRDVLPKDPRPWYKQRHLVLLNLAMIIPALSSTTNGYDGSLLNGELQSHPRRPKVLTRTVHSSSVYKCYHTSEYLELLSYQRVCIATIMPLCVFSYYHTSMCFQLLLYQRVSTVLIAIL